MIISLANVLLNFFYKTFYKFNRKVLWLTEKIVKIDQGLITKQIIENTENIFQKTFYYKTNEALIENNFAILKKKTFFFLKFKKKIFSELLKHVSFLV